MTAAYEWLAEASIWWWPKFADHLWQTTLFALVVLGASLLLRKGPARSRHNFWLLASAKFIVPAAFFVFFAQQAGVGSLSFFRSAPDADQSSLMVNGVTQPVSALASNYEVTVVASAPRNDQRIYFVLTGVWFSGCATLLSVWGIRRRKFLHSLKLGSRLRDGREWQVLERARETLNFTGNVGLVISPLQIEPAVWHVWRPVVVMPESIASQLDDQELEAIMLHELVHIQRHDNLISNLQLGLCALLWFHPLVWFISRKLFDEREQACDERVLEVCGAPEAYALSILKVVRFCFGWRAVGAIGAASGTNLRRRIENIMTLGNSRRRTGRASNLLAGALVGTALLVLVGAGVYSNTRGASAMANGIGTEQLATTPVNEPELSANVATEASSAQRKNKPAPPAPPSQPAQPPQPAEAPEPPSAPQPASVPHPASAPNPASAPKPPAAPHPVSVPAPSSAPHPASAPHPGSVPRPAAAPQPPLQPAFGAGAGKGSGVGRGVSGAVGRGIGRDTGIGAATAPRAMATPPSPDSAPATPVLPAKAPVSSRPKSQEERSHQSRQDKTEKGELIEAPQPVYPEDARQKKIEGTLFPV